MLGAPPRCIEQGKRRTRGVFDDEERAGSEKRRDEDEQGEEVRIRRVVRAVDSASENSQSRTALIFYPFFYRFCPQFDRFVGWCALPRRSPGQQLAAAGVAPGDTAPLRAMRNERLRRDDDGDERAEKRARRRGKSVSQWRQIIGIHSCGESLSELAACDLAIIGFRVEVSLLLETLHPLPGSWGQCVLEHRPCPMPAAPCTAAPDPAGCPSSTFSSWEVQ